MALQLFAAATVAAAASFAACATSNVAGEGDASSAADGAAAVREPAREAGTALDGSRDGARDGAPPDAGVDGRVPLPEAGRSEAGCEILSYVDAPLPVTWIPAVPPQPSGGTIADGTYRMIRKDYYVGPNGVVDPPQVRPTVWLKVTGATWLVSTQVGSADQGQRVSVSSPLAAYLTLAPGCGDVIFDETVQYQVVSDAGSTELRLYHIGGEIIVDTYHLQ
jgi:hypothetical protein